MSTERFCKYVSSRGIAQSCDIYPRDILSDSQNFDITSYQGIANNHKVYVISSQLPQFVTKVLPALEKSNIRIRLVTGACVLGVPNELSRVHRIDYLKRLFCQSHSVLMWYTQNYDGRRGQCGRVKAIPLGLDYHTLQRGAMCWGPQASAKEQDEELDRLYRDALPFSRRWDRSFSYYHFRMFRRHNADRYVANAVLKQREFNVFLNSKQPRNRTWRLSTLYKFVISPHGNGLDCHRTYEAMCLGCIPVVRSSSLDELYRGMPVIVLDKWDTINMPDLLERGRRALSNGREKLTLKYWTDFIGG